MYEMFFGLPLDVDVKSQKFKKWREFLIITGLSFLKRTYKKCSPLAAQIAIAHISNRQAREIRN